MLTREPIPSPIDTIPEPELVRDRLSELFIEAALLRSLLRLAERKAHYQKRTSDYQEGSRAC